MSVIALYMMVYKKIQMLMGIIPIGKYVKQTKLQAGNISNLVDGEKFF